MKEFVHSWKFKVIICIFALLIGFMVYAAMAAGAASLPERILHGITAPFAQLSTNIANFVEGNIDKVVNADKYKQENEELRKLVSELTKRNVNISELQNDNRMLREMLAITEQHPDFEWPSNISKIAFWNSNDVFRGFTISSGSDDGISLRDLVFTQIGVVGIVTQVAPTYSQISTILAPETEIGVMSMRNNVSGLLQNDILFARDGFCRMSYIEPGADIDVGDTIVTIGTGSYPANQIIGEVVEVYDDPNGMSKHAVIKPSEDVFGLTSVLVVTGFEGKEVLSIFE